MKEIKIKQFSYPDFELLEGGEHVIRLTDHHLYSEARSRAKVLDEELAMTIERVFDNVYQFRKEHISGIELFWSNSQEIYWIHISCNTSVVGIPSKERPTELFAQLQKWYSGE